MALKGQDIVCVGFSDWNNPIVTNEKHLLSRMAKDNNILFQYAQQPGREWALVEHRLRPVAAQERAAAEHLHLLCDAAGNGLLASPRASSFVYALVRFRPEADIRTLTLRDRWVILRRF